MAHNLLSFFGWAFLPNLVTSWVQTIYYGVKIRAGDAKPQPGSPRHASDRRVIHILVVTFYLLYTIYEADNDILRASNYYVDLGVAPSAADKEIKSRFRRLAAIHHPDKSADSADYYMHLKLASETLQDAARRFAYERFGPDVVRWTKSKTVRDFVSRGVLQGVLPHYVIAGATMYVVGLFGYMDFGKFYRWLILAFLCVFEVWTVTRPTFPHAVNLLNSVVTTVSAHPPYLPFQIISLARKVTITVYIAFSQIGPLLAMHWGVTKGLGVAGSGGGEDDEKALRQGLDRLDGVAKALDDDAARLMDMEMAPYRGNHEATVGLQGKMKEWLIQNTIRADPMVRDAVGTSYRKRRMDAPAGARGNR